MKKKLLLKCLGATLFACIFNQADAQYYFTNSEANPVSIPDGTYDGNFATMAQKQVSFSGIPADKHFVAASISLQLTHTWAGDLAVKMVDPYGFILGIMSRPGVVETADDGNDTAGFGTSVDLAGNNSDLYIYDYSDVLTEDIGTLGNPVPDETYLKPSQGAMSSFGTTFQEFFTGLNSGDFGGTYTLYVGDAGTGDVGTFDYFGMELMFDDYCVPHLDNDLEYITNVNFAGINQNSSQGINGMPNYNTVAFGASPASVTKGETFPISVTIFPDSNDYIYVFFDWNGDFDFGDEGETFTVVANTSSPGPHILDIPVPATAIIGETRMRVMLGYDDPAPNPCLGEDGSFGDSGEVEDYTVMINPSMGTEEFYTKKINVFPNPVVDVVNFSSTNRILQIQIMDLTGKVVYTKNADTVQLDLNLSELAAGVYIAKVKTNKGAETVKLIKK